MSSRSYGALPHQDLIQFIKSGFICGADDVEANDVSPASLDLRLSDEAYRVHSVTMPNEKECIVDLLTYMEAQKHDLSMPLRKGEHYLIRLQESLELPSEEYYGFCNPKSSTGRLDVHVRVITDGVPRYDSVPSGYKGPLWLYVTPRTFGIRVRVGDTLAQLRLFNGDTRLSRHDMITAFAEHHFAWTTNGTKLPYKQLRSFDKDGGLMLSLMLPKDGDVFGYRCIAAPDNVLDLSERNVDPTRYFVPEIVRNGAAHIVKDRFYILSSAEAIRIPPDFAAEMRAMDDRSGEFRSHYAGFLDPGWGWGSDGKAKGRPFTLELRSFEQLVIRPGQPVAMIKYERMLSPATLQYDDPMKGSHYTTQNRPQLAKQFAPFPY